MKSSDVDLRLIFLYADILLRLKDAQKILLEVNGILEFEKDTNDLGLAEDLKGVTLDDVVTRVDEVMKQAKKLHQEKGNDGKFNRSHGR